MQQTKASTETVETEIGRLEGLITSLAGITVSTDDHSASVESLTGRITVLESQMTDAVRKTAFDELSATVGEMQPAVDKIAGLESRMAALEAQMVATNNCLDSSVREGSTCAAPATLVSTSVTTCSTDNNGQLRATSGGDLEMCFSTSWRKVNAPSRFVAGFDQYEGLDLSSEGWTQCFGWDNDGSTRAPLHARVREMCGDFKRILFAGWRSGASRSLANLIRFDCELSSSFVSFLPDTSSAMATTRWVNFDINKRYSWHVSGAFYLLTSYNNAWSDPGRLWEPCVNGLDYDCHTAHDGHVLSQSGNQAHDQYPLTGDVYLIYVQ
eukprot:m.144567 g.144567  ORF g.144567 m.144567 type:complete len:325 (-) comp10065_c0_seq3:474-1448(-)